MHQFFSARAALLGAALYMGLLAVPAAAAEPEARSTFTAAQRDELRIMMRGYLLEHPEVITEALSLMQAKEEATRAQTQKVALKDRRQELIDPAEGTVIGNPKGDVTVVEFFDYNCGYCKSMFPAVMDLLKEDGKIRLVTKELPILGPSSVSASKAALAAVKQGKYAPFHMALLSHKGGLSDETIMSIAKDVDLDLGRLKDDMKAPEIEKTIARNRDLAQSLNVTGTPALVIGNTFVPGAISKADLKGLVAKARAKP